jgi:hypothetical protein
MAWMTICSTLLAGSAIAQVQVTSLQGRVTADDRRVALHSELGDKTLEVAADARCSLLLGDQVLVRICGIAVAKFSYAEDSRPGSVELSHGELKAMAYYDDAPFSIVTPTAHVVVRGATAHVSVAPDTGDTSVTALDGRLRVSGRDQTSAVDLNAGQQLVLRRGQKSTNLDAAIRESRALDSPCVNDAAEFNASLRAERQILVDRLPPVGARPGNAAVHPVSDLEQIVSADIPEDGLPLEDSSAPSALVTELGKRGMDEEICDPITCNPAYRTEQPGVCGVPPVRPCIP